MSKNYKQAALVFTNRICDDDGNIVKGDTRNLTYQREARPVAETLEEFNNIKREWEKMAEEDDPEMAKIETAVSVTNFPIVYLDIKMGTEDNRWFVWKMEMVGIEERAVTTTKETITKETILEVLKELVNEVAYTRDIVSKKLGKFGWIKIDMKDEVEAVDIDDLGRDVWGNVLTVHLTIADDDDFNPEVDEEYNNYEIIEEDSTVYEESDTVQTLVESGELDLEEIAAIFAKDVERYQPRYE